MDGIPLHNKQKTKLFSRTINEKTKLMETNFNIKNFRIFDNDGADIEFKPITILTGCNSSGKSSAVKGLFLLESFMAQIKKAVEDKASTIDLGKFRLDFSTYPNNTLGRFGKVLNRSCNADGEFITFGYSKHSSYLSRDINAVMSFSSNKNDDLDNGYLYSLELYVDDELFYRACKNSEPICNLNVIKDYCADFVLTELAAHRYSSLRGAYEISGELSEEEYTSRSGEAKTMLLQRGERYAAEVCAHARHSMLNRILDPEKVGNDLDDYLNALDQTTKENSFFVIPVVKEYLSSIEAKDFKKACFSLLGDNVLEDTNLLLDKISEDFISSNAENFKEYFANKEIEFLSDSHRSSFLRSGRLKLPSIYDLYPEQDFSLQNPLNYSIGYFGKDNNFQKTADEEQVSEKKANLESWEQKSLSFGWLYEFVMDLNTIYTKGKEIETYYKMSENGFESYYLHHSYYILANFACSIIKDSLLPVWVDCLSYVGSARVDVKRLYSLENKNSFSVLLKRYFEGKKRYLDNNNREVNKDYIPDSFINYWIQKFGIGEKISLEFDKEGFGVQIRLFKHAGEDSQLLADEGYGVTQLVSVLLEIETAILNSKPIYNHNYYGMQELPGVKVETLPQAVTIALEEPEIHLHPKYQSLLADMFVNAIKEYNIHFIIETHSEYLIRKLQVLTTEKYEKQVSNEDISIYYIDNGDGRKIGICKNGYLDDDFGTGFYDEAVKLSRDLML